MSQDTKSSLSRRRSRGLSLHQRQIPKQHAQARTEPRSQYTTDPFLQDFLAPSFDPVSYLNAILPPLGTSTTTPANNHHSPISLAELNEQTQTLLSQLGAHTTRLTNTLTQLTDDILRSGSRLAYEVELLRGETLGLSETLTDGLKDDIELFVPGGIQDGSAAAPSAPTKTTTIAERRMSISSTGAGASETQQDGTADTTTHQPIPPTNTTQASQNSTDPAYITQLRTLSLVRARLESVIKIFGDAMEFVFPPSQLSVTSSFLSVSAPAGDAPSAVAAGDHTKGIAPSTEEKGQQVLQRLRDEITRLLAGQAVAAGESPVPTASTTSTAESKTAAAVRGIEQATERIEALKELSSVWKGTAEEKGRAKFVDELARMVEDRHRELVRELESEQLRGGSGGGGAVRRGDGGAAAAAAAETRGPLGGYGFISQLQKIRSGL